MPELPDITVYCKAIETRAVGRPIAALRFASPFVLRTVTPAPQDFAGEVVTGLSRLGKRIVIHTRADLAIVIHLMIAGRLQWKEAGSPLKGTSLAAVDFEHGALVLTEAASRKRASIHLVRGADALRDMDPGGAEIAGLDVPGFAALLRSERHTLKRALTDPRLFSGIGNAYSDEILHEAQLSPFARTQTLSDEDAARLLTAVQHVLDAWTERLLRETGSGWPKHVTAFRPEMAVHGKFGQPCPRCGEAVQRIAYADNECNYCPTCQTDGRLLADRGLSRLLREDWPRTLDELEQMKNDRRERRNS